MSLFRVIGKFNFILTKQQKIKIIQLVVLMVIGGFFEMLSVTMIFPMIDVATNPESIANSKYVGIFYNALKVNDYKKFVVILAIVLALIYIIKNVFLLYEYNYQYRFVYQCMFNMKRQLLDIFVRQPYEFFLYADSGDLIRIVNNDTSTAFALLTTILTLLTEGIVSLCLIVATFIIAPMITFLIAIILLCLLVIIQRFVKPILTKAGKEYKEALTGENKWLLQTIEGIKEIKVSNVEGYFEGNYNRYGQNEIKNRRRESVLATIPRLSIEAVCMSSLLIVVALMMYFGNDPQAMIPMLSAVALAAVRLFPSANRISAAFANIAFQEPMLDSLIDSIKKVQNIQGSHKNLVEIEDVNKETYEDRIVKKFRYQLQVQDIRYHYPQSETYVLDTASLIVNRGETIGIVGESGAGKTTLADIMLGLLNPQEGSMMVDGIPIQNDIEGWLGQVGYIPQSIFMIDDSIKENVVFGHPVDDIDDAAVWEAIEAASLGEYVRGLSEGINTKIGERGLRISGGQKQRIGIARALYRKPNVLFFDEATSALDNETETTIMESIAFLKGKQTIIIIAHRLSTIEACDHVYRVKDGKIIKER